MKFSMQKNWEKKLFIIVYVRTIYYEHYPYGNEVIGCFLHKPQNPLFRILFTSINDAAR